MNTDVQAVPENQDAKIYGRTFFEKTQDDSLESARQIVPVLVSLFKPTSVVDVGCGVGTWLKVFQEQGIEDVLGVDGDYVDRGMLFIPKTAFVPFDLRRPLKLPRRFDLALSVEAAEHLPPESAEAFVQSLTSLADVVAFSAAVPSQAKDPGVHLNEQWPDYWARLFQGRGYLPVDCIRRRIWTEDRVCWWYAQNLICYVKKDASSRYAHLLASHADESSSLGSLSLVHPRFFKQYAEFGDMSFTRKTWLLKKILAAMGRHVLNRITRSRRG